MKEATIDPTGIENATIPAASVINNSDIEDGWEKTIDIEDSDKKAKIGTLDDPNNNKPNGENRNGHSGTTTHNMGYNGNNPDSQDPKGDDTIIYKTSCK